MNWFDATLLGAGLSLLFAMYFRCGRASSAIHPLNVTILTVLFEFYGKFIWIEFGSPLSEPGYSYTRPLLFILLFISFLGMFLLFFPWEISNLVERMVPRISFSKKECWTMVVLAATINMGLAVIAGGSPIYGLINPIEFRIFMQKGGMFYFEFLMFFLLISGIAVLCWEAMRDGTMLKAFFVVPYCLAIVVALNSGLRGRVAEIFLLPAVVYAVRNRRLPVLPLVIISSLIIPFVTIFGMYRDAVRENSLDFQQVVSFVEKSADSGTEFFPLFMHRFDAFDNFVTVMGHGDEDFYYFESMVDFLVQPVPRALWESKAQNFTSEMTRYFRPDLFDDGIALTYSAFSEAYLNFGFVAGAFLLAAYIFFVVRFIECLAELGRENGAALVMFCILYQVPFIVISAGFINDVASVFLILTFIIIYLFYFARRIKIG